jgi:predicted transcriptional regulator
LQKYLKFLLGNELIHTVEVGNPSVRYHVTQKGADLLKSIEAVMDLLDIEA